MQQLCDADPSSGSQVRGTQAGSSAEDGGPSRGRDTMEPAANAKGKMMKLH
jgi:hypothetical protein